MMAPSQCWPKRVVLGPIVGVYPHYGGPAAAETALTHPTEWCGIAEGIMPMGGAFHASYGWGCFAPSPFGGRMGVRKGIKVDWIGVGDG